jgi:hypothetical protein
MLALAFDRQHARGARGHDDLLTARRRAVRQAQGAVRDDRPLFRHDHVERDRRIARLLDRACASRQILST